MKGFLPTVHTLIYMDSHATGVNANDKQKEDNFSFGNQRLGHSISNCPSELKVWGMKCDLSKKINVITLVHHIKLGIRIDL